MGMVHFLVYMLTLISIYGFIALSLNLQYGLCGLSNFGQVGFVMIGAYSSVILVVLAHMPFPVGLVGGMVMAALLGFFISLTVARLKADYWAIMTLATAEIIRLIFLNQTLGGTYQGASFGIANIPQPLTSLFSADVYPFFYLGMVLVFLALAYLVLRLLAKSPFGRILKAIREGEELPEAFGKNVRRFKTKVLVVGGALGGAAGSLLAHFSTYIDSNYFLPIETFLVWAMVVVGGRGNFSGTLLGTLIVMVFYSSTRFIKDYIPINVQVLAALRMVLIGVLIVFVMLFMEDGLLKEKKEIHELRRRNAHR